MIVYTPSATLTTPSATPSLVAFFLYSLSSLFFASGGGLSATGDWAYLVAIVAGIYGPAFVLTFAVSAVLSLRGSREDVALDRLADEMKAKARAHEEAFCAMVPGGIPAACKNFERLGLPDVPRIVSWIEHEMGSDLSLNKGALPQDGGAA